MIKILCALALGVLCLSGCAGDLPAATCSHKGQSCKTDADCCPNEGLVCNNGCRVGTVGPTIPMTSIPSTSTTVKTTTTSIAGSTTSTTLMAMTPPYDPTLGDIGLHWTTQSQELLFNHQTGQPLNQADGWLLTLYLRGVAEPEAIEAASEIPSCADALQDMLASTSVTTDKFLFDYVLRPVVSGGTYAVHGNYLWDLTHNEYLLPLRSCLLDAPQANAGWLAAHPTWQQALDLRVDAGFVVRGDATYRIPSACAATWTTASDRRVIYACSRASIPSLADEEAGAVDAHVRDVPLTLAQCAKLHAFHVAHRDSRGVQAARMAFIASAETYRQRMLFAIAFTGLRNPQRPGNGVTRALDDLKHAQFNGWVDAFGCATPDRPATPPNLAAIIAKLFGHMAAHNLLASPPGSKLRSICPETLSRQSRKAVVNCPWVEG